MPYQITKTYGHELGLSACFRQWRADSHCRYIHGYALAFAITFEADTLDARRWVIDYGGMAELKQRIKDTFDHKLLVAADDPGLRTLEQLAELGLANVIVWPDVGCESFAAIVFSMAREWLARYLADEPSVAWDTMPRVPRVRVVSVTCSEHGANSATFLSTP